MEDSTYDAEKIQVLEGLEAVRKRPSMYIGSTDFYGLHHLVYEVVDNSIDEAMAGFCTTITVIMNEDGSVTVEDDGRGIPIGMHKKYKQDALELVLTKLHSGGKFDRKTYKVSGGLHGVGLSVVNALSETLEVKIKRQGKFHVQRYERGVPTGPIKVDGEAQGTGTIIRFKPDPQIFESTQFSYETLSARMRELAFLNKGLKVTISEPRSAQANSYKFDGGIVEYVQFMNRNKTCLHEKPVYINIDKDGISIEIGMQYTDTYARTSTRSRTTSTPLRADTSHRLQVRPHEDDQRLLKKYGFPEGQRRLAQRRGREGRPHGRAQRQGPGAAVRGQTKTKLGNSDIKGIVESAVSEKLFEFLEENPKVAQACISKALLAASAREAARKARELTRRKGLLDIGSLLASWRTARRRTCEVRDLPGRGRFRRREREASQGQDLPGDSALRGKILNVEKARLEKMLKNAEIRTLITALGTSVDTEFDISKARYHRVCIMTDADVDGAHIRTLLLTFFFRNMKPLIEHGYIYIAQPPLYRVKKGKSEKYVYSDRELAETLESSARGPMSRGTRAWGDEPRAAQDYHHGPEH